MQTKQLAFLLCVPGKSAWDQPANGLFYKLAAFASKPCKDCLCQINLHMPILSTTIQHCNYVKYVITSGLGVMKELVQSKNSTCS